MGGWGILFNFFLMDEILQKLENIERRLSSLESRVSGPSQAVRPAVPPPPPPPPDPGPDPDPDPDPTPETEQKDFNVDFILPPETPSGGRSILPQEN